jgi:hypothetical protein
VVPGWRLVWAGHSDVSTGATITILTMLGLVRTFRLGLFIINTLPSLTVRLVRTTGCRDPPFLLVK